MSNRRSSILTFILSIGCFISLSESGSAQSRAHVPVVTLGEINGRYTTRDSMLLAPKLICHDEGCVVKSFNIMILPADREIIGPYWIAGDQLTEKMKDTLKKLPNLRTRVFIDSIEVKTGNRKMQVPGISLQFDH